jgi:transcriptional regulator with XRE-family HTH domain
MEHLNAWLDATHRSYIDLAELMNVDPSAAWRWTRGKTLPNYARMVEIERATGGAVPVSCWASSLRP